MKKVLVVGAGRMGRAIAYGLHKLGVDVTITDIYEDSVKYACREAEFPLNAITGDYGVFTEWDAVVSASTYTGNLEIAKWAVDNEIPYFDLGGHVGTSKEIQDYATYHNGIVFTDLGLAPGLANILAERACDELVLIGDKPVSLKIRVGGLPAYPGPKTGLLKYNLTWSIEGLINEYLDDCKVLEDGVIKTVPGLSDIESYEGEAYECFHTSGGIAHTLTRMLDRGLVNANYKTIRYKGHAEKINFLLEIAQGDIDILKKLIKNSTGTGNEDIAIVYIRAEGIFNTITKRYTIEYDSRFTAMQKATAFPVAAVVKSFLEEFHPGFFAGPLSYEEIPFLSFKKHLKTLGIEV